MPTDVDVPEVMTPKLQSYARRSQRMAARHPNGAHLFSSANRVVFRLTRGHVGARVKGVPIGLLTTTGRRSGRSRTVPVVYLEDGTRYLVVSSNSGLDHPPAWYLNLMAHPEAELQTGTGRARVLARELNGPERREVWPRLLGHNPVWGAYQSCTERALGVMALQRLEADTAGDDNR